MKTTESVCCKQALLKPQSINVGHQVQLDQRKGDGDADGQDKYNVSQMLKAERWNRMGKEWGKVEPHV